MSAVIVDGSQASVRFDRFDLESYHALAERNIARVMRGESVDGQMSMGSEAVA